jgi:hypothetical protein
VSGTPQRVASRAASACAAPGQAHINIKYPADPSRWLPAGAALADNDHVSEVVIIRTRRGKDGRDYLVPMPPPLAWRWEVVRLTHQLAHEQGLSEAATRRELLRRGYRRSSGTVHNDLERPMPTCARCRAAGG